MVTSSNIFAGAVKVKCKNPAVKAKILRKVIHHDTKIVFFLALKVFSDLSDSHFRNLGQSSIAYLPVLSL